MVLLIANIEGVYIVATYLSGIGKFFIVGVFVDKKGQFWNREEIIPQQTIVLNAEIIMDNKSAKTMMSFTYEAGH